MRSTLAIAALACLALLVAPWSCWADQTPFTLSMQHGPESFTASLTAVGPTTDPSGTVPDAYHAISGTLDFTSTRYPQLNGIYSLDSQGSSFIYPNGDAVQGVITHNQIVRSYLDGDGLAFSSPSGSYLYIWGAGLSGMHDILPPTGTVWDGSYGINVNGYIWEHGVPVTVANTAPEPGSLTLVGVGVCCLGGNGWRRRKQAATAWSIRKAKKESLCRPGLRVFGLGSRRITLAGSHEGYGMKHFLRISAVVSLLLGTVERWHGRLGPGAVELGPARHSSRLSGHLTRLEAA